MTQHRRNKITPQNTNDENLSLFTTVNKKNNNTQTFDAELHSTDFINGTKQTLLNNNITDKKNQLEDKVVDKSIIRKKGTSVQTVDRVETSGYTLGGFLQEARVKAGFSLNQVAMLTKLSIHYIEAIERDDFKNTPPHIYVKAYVKKLSSLYEVDEQKSLSLLQPFGDYETNISNTIMHDLQETKQVNQQDENRIKIFFKVIYIAAGFVVGIGIILGCYLWITSDGSSVQNKPLTPAQNAAITKKMEKLIVPESISLTELKVKKK